MGLLCSSFISIATLSHQWHIISRNLCTRRKRAEYIKVWSHPADHHAWASCQWCCGAVCSKESLAVNMWSSAQLTLPEGSWTPCRSHLYLDKAIHHPHCSAQFRVLLLTASGSSAQLYMDVTLMRALETCLVALTARRKVLRGINESIPEDTSTPIVRCGSKCEFFLCKCFIEEEAAQ